MRLSGNVLASFAAGAIWAISPSGGTVAVWASCFNINVAAASMSFCATAYDIMRSGTSRRPALPGAVASFFLLLGLLSYETAIAESDVVGKRLYQVRNNMQLVGGSSMPFNLAKAGLDIISKGRIPGGRKPTPTPGPSMKK